VAGNWERAISIQRTSDSYVVQARSWLPDEVGGVLWFGPHTPHATSYTPFPTGVSALPASFSAGHQGALEKDTAFWKIRYVAQAMILKFNYTRVDVAMAQKALLSTATTALRGEEKRWLGGTGDRVSLTKTFLANAAHFAKVYDALFDHILFKYADGWINAPKLGEGVGYPATWLRDVGYPNGPPPIPNARAEAERKCAHPMVLDGCDQV
jgi:dipeptidase